MGAKSTVGGRIRARVGGQGQHVGCEHFDGEDDAEKEDDKDKDKDDDDEDEDNDGRQGQGYMG